MQEEAAMQSFLQRVELEKYLPAFRSLGVESFADFEQVVQRYPCYSVPDAGLQPCLGSHADI